MRKYFSTYFTYLEKQDKRTRFAITLAAVGLLLFLAIAVTVPLRNGILTLLFQKTPSSAAGTTEQTTPGACAAVLNSNGEINKSFCFDSSSPNIVQDAIDYAVANNLRDVQLTSGTFVLNKKITAFVPGPKSVAIYLPSNITLKGSTDPANPSIIKISKEVGVIDIILYIGYRTEPAKAVENVTVSNITLDGKTDNELMTYLAIWTTRANGEMIIDHVTAKNTKSSAMSLGYYAQYQLSSGNQGTLYLFNGTPDKYNKITNNIVENTGGDGIIVMGQYNEITGNKVSNATIEGISNCLGSFIGSANNVFKNNELDNCFAGIGIDGSYPLYLSSPINDILEFNKILGEAGIGNEEGFGRNIIIENNRINNSTWGVGLWRNSNAIIRNNTIIGNSKQDSKGIFLNESRDNYVVGNNISNVDTGIVLRSIGYSQVGSKYNGIGVIKEGNEYPIIGNAINNTKFGVYFDGKSEFLTDNTFRGNTFTNSSVAYCDFTNSQNTISTNNLPESCNIGGSIPTPTLPPPTPTPTPITTQKSTLIPNADTFVEKENPTKNYGSHASARVDANPKDTALLKFDTSTLVGKTIIKAVLRLYVTDASTAQASLLGAGEQWGENNVTWNTKPNIGSLITSLPIGALNNYVEVDITSYITPRIGQKIAFALNTASTDSFWFASKETVNKPQLVITYR